MFATIFDFDSKVDPKCNSLYHTTIHGYHKAGASDTEIKKKLDAGREPFLYSLTEQELGRHPLVEIHDMLAETQDGMVGVVLAQCNKPYFLPPNTLVIWRGEWEKNPC